MPAIGSTEARPGLVVHVDTAILRAIGSSRTNAEISGPADRAVIGPHYFLVVDRIGEEVLAVPLFSHPAPGSELLREGLKSGMADKWLGERSYFSRWQHWRVLIGALAAASGDEESEPADRRRYADASPATLARIASWANKNRAPWRSL